jgi:DNA-binding transcriptional ArsR family regulator
MIEYDALLGRSRIRRDLLRRLYETPLPRLHLRELARGAHTSAGTAARELGRLEDMGLISRVREGAQVYFQADAASPLYGTVRDLVRLTIGAVDVIRRELAGLDGVESAVIFGSYAAGTMQPSSDIDILVIGTPDRDDLTERLERCGREVRRSVNDVAMTHDELVRRRASGDGLVTSIDESPTISVIP